MGSLIRLRSMREVKVRVVLLGRCLPSSRRVLDIRHQERMIGNRSLKHEHPHDSIFITTRHRVRESRLVTKSRALLHIINQSYRFGQAWVE